MTQLREYLVIAKSHEDLEDIYADMENEGGSLHIPNRAVDLAERRPTSRNTHYWLTADEAEQIKNDPRIQDVELEPFKELGVVNKTHWIDPAGTNNYYRDWANDEGAVQRNWGLSRVVNGPSNLTKLWGIGTFVSDEMYSWGTYYSYGTYDSQTNTKVQIDASGKNVDVIIIDNGAVPTDHPEYAKNSDGTGGTRCVNYDWYQHNTAIGRSASATAYDYTNYGYHAIHVTGIVAGNRQGWARDANIYNASFPFNTNDSGYTFDYIKQFHLNKAINPATGRKNPTIVNCSWTASLADAQAWASIRSVTFRGVTTVAPTGGSFTADQLYSWHIHINTGAMNMEHSSAYAADWQDCIDAGIIIIAAAGNDNMRCASVGDQDWDNTMTVVTNAVGSTETYYYERRGVPGVLGTTATRMNIGSLNSVALYDGGQSDPSPDSQPEALVPTATNIEQGYNGYTFLGDPGEMKATYSTYGPGVDLMAPGTAIFSTYTNESVAGITPVVDPRSSTHYLQKQQGTSMASPQVAGISACIMEKFPHFTQAELKAYILKYCTTNTCYDWSTTAVTDAWTHGRWSLYGGPNRVIGWNSERPTTGATYPNTRKTSRPTTGAMYPRPRNSRK